MVPIYWKNTGLRVSSKVGSKVLKSGFQGTEKWVPGTRSGFQVWDSGFQSNGY